MSMTVTDLTEEKKNCLQVHPRTGKRKAKIGASTMHSLRDDSMSTTTWKVVKPTWYKLG